MLVNVQDSREFASQVLNRDVWSDDNVKDVIREHFVFWQVFCDIMLKCVDESNVATCRFTE